MPSVFEVEHCPEFSIRIRFRDLVERCIILIHDFVDRTHDSSVLDSPPQVPAGFTSDDIVLDLLLRDGRDGRGGIGVALRGKELGDAEVALG